MCAKNITRKEFEPDGAAIVKLREEYVNIITVVDIDNLR